MFGRLFDVLGLAWPIAFAGLFLAAAICPRKYLPRRTIRLVLNHVIESALPGMVHHARQPFNYKLFRFVMAAATAICLMIPAFRDYSGFFPEHMNVAAYFDDIGIEQSLTAFEARELEPLRMASDWRQRKEHYFAHLNEELSKNGIDFKIDTRPGAMLSSGVTTVKTKKLQWGPLQSYVILEMYGTLNHSTTGPDDVPRKVSSDFRLLQSPGRTVRAALYDIYFGWHIVIMPLAQQTFRVSPTREVGFDRIIGITKIRFFPTVDPGRTIYFSVASDGMTFPIGYADYYPI